MSDFVANMSDSEQRFVVDPGLRVSVLIATLGLLESIWLDKLT